MLQRRFVADADRPIAAIAFQVGRDDLVEAFSRHDAVDRPQRILSRDAEDEGDETLHRFRRAETIERFDDEIGVSEPTVAVIPRAPGAWRFGYGRRQRGDDGAGLLEIGKLERDRGADDGILPVVS